MQLSNTELATFFDQMAMILHAGIPSIEGLAIMGEDLSSKEGGRILNVLYRSMEDTGSLYMAMEKSEVFPSYAVELVKIGEQTGHLEKVLSSLAAYYTREEDVKNSIKSAVSYPLIMIGMMFVIILVLIIKVMPMFNNVFLQLGSELTGFSRSVMEIGLVLSRYSFAFIILLVVLAAGAAFLAFTKKGAKLRPKIAYHFFATKKLARQMAISKFSAGLSLTIGSGLDVEQSLEMSARLVSHPEIAQQIRNCQELMENEHLTFPQALFETGLFTGLQTRMIAVGYRTGALDTLMEKLSANCDEEIDSRLSRLISVLEPTLVVILSVIVGLILLSVMLPLLGIMTNMG
ncbi:MAG TPA: type II secretion system F family protein [Candidatus Scybalocola faecavium]|nr:type II secretion system F family protein [Candidatus Scybalocola faecavium]